MHNIKATSRTVHHPTCTYIMLLHTKYSLLLWVPYLLPPPPTLAIIYCKIQYTVTRAPGLSPTPPYLKSTTLHSPIYLLSAPLYVPGNFYPKGSLFLPTQIHNLYTTPLQYLSFNPTKMDLWPPMLTNDRSEINHLPTKTSFTAVGSLNLSTKIGLYFRNFPPFQTILSLTDAGLVILLNPFLVVIFSIFHTFLYFTFLLNPHFNGWLSQPMVIIATPHCSKIDHCTGGHLISPFHQIYNKLII